MYITRFNDYWVREQRKMHLARLAMREKCIIWKSTKSFTMNFRGRKKDQNEVMKVKGKFTCFTLGAV